VLYTNVKKHLKGMILDVGFGACNYMVTIHSLDFHCIDIDGSIMNVENAILKGYEAYNADFKKRLRTLLKYSELQVIEQF
jgi:hypothetical protein